MTRFRYGLAGVAKIATFAALVFGAFGCELIATVDRSRSAASGGSGGSGGTGGASTSSGGGGSNAECTTADECADPGNECVTRTCDGGQCGTAPVPVGTPVAMQTQGDCKVKQCDGAGAAVVVNDNHDVFDDHKACTDDTCVAGVPTNAPSAEGTACGTGLTCDGNGACVGCVAPGDCPGQDSECQTRTCTAGICGTDFAASGTPIAAQTDGDCKESQCDGAGVVVHGQDNDDLPVDGNDCTDDVCTGGEASNPVKMAGGTCSQMGGTVCNDAGACVECNVASSCPGVDNECQTRTCTAGRCGIAFVADGTPTATQTWGDCKVVQCNGAGATRSANADNDLPDDSNPCTSDVCTAGVPSNPVVASGTTCGADQVCNAAGACVGCVVASTCPGVDNECQTRTCNAGTCGITFTAAGTPVATQTAGDCKLNTCNGAGAVVAATDNADVPVDGVQCTNDVCTAGAPSNPPAIAGVPCTQMGGTVCSGGGVCVECLAAATCAGTDAECRSRTCLTGVCGFANTAAGTVTAVQAPGDCQENQCDGSGNITSVAKNTDVPADDGVQCTNEVCTAGAPAHPPATSGTVCNQSGGIVCNATGTCVACVVDADCASGMCRNNVCEAPPPACDDGIKNGSESDIDCGGSCPTACALALACTVDGDCTSGICTNHVCSQVNGCDYSNATDLTGGAPVTITFANGNFSYLPRCIRVTANTVVTFNGTFASHPLQGGQVVGGVVTPAGSGPFVPVTSTGTTKAVTMSAVGTFPYYCVPHAVSRGMTGAVLVVP